MNMVYTVTHSAGDGGRTRAVDCYFQSQTGQMGFARHPALWAALVDGGWVYDRKAATFADGGPNALTMVKANMRPFAVVVFPTSAESVSWIDAYVSSQRRARVEATRARLKGDTAPRQAQTFASSVLELEEIEAALPEQCEAQIWRFGDRGEFCTLLVDGPFDRSRVAGVIARLGVPTKPALSTSQVPVW